MKNVKDQVYAALLNVIDNVSDLYPDDWDNMPAIQYVEEENVVVTKTDDNREEISGLTYRIEIWNDGSTSQLALAVDDALSALGLTRTTCMDSPDPSGKRHKVMRFVGNMDIDTEQVFWEYNR